MNCATARLNTDKPEVAFTWSMVSEGTKFADCLIDGATCTGSSRPHPTQVLAHHIDTAHARGGHCSPNLQRSLHPPRLATAQSAD